MLSPGWVACADPTAKLVMCSTADLAVSRSGQKLLTTLTLDFCFKGEALVHGTAVSPEEGSENDHGVPSSKKMQGERGGGAALKENVCQVKSLKKSLKLHHCEVFSVDSGAHECPRLTQVASWCLL